MEQLTQLLKDGDMRLLEVPYPLLTAGRILVRNHYSVISTGTEGKTVHDARLGYLSKARARRDEVRKVISAARTYGLRDTYQMVMNKLEAPSPLGYSCAGEVMAVADDVTGFKAGDFVACGGNTANHAEVVSVPVNLAVKIQESANLKHAAFATLGAVAMQGIRQADLRLGEYAVVIGMGLIGQLTAQMLQAAGVRVAGIDLDDAKVKMAGSWGCNLAFNRNAEGLEEKINGFTHGYGADAVIITAGAKSTDPVDLAGSLCRQKGKVVVVGSVPTGFGRPAYYRKELELRMSCSYGPGRYDTDYEEKGIDYPIGYVRWTENRNMQAFTELLDQGKLNLDHLITHEFSFRDAPDAYQLILDKKQPFSGVVLKYDTSRQPERSIRLRQAPAPGPIRLGMIGAGSFAQNFLLPAMPAQVEMVSVVTARGQTARHVADKYGFAGAVDSSEEIFSDDSINTVIIATRHDQHAGMVLNALQAGKNVFVEKPLALYATELEQIRESYDAMLGEGARNRFAEKQNGHPHTPSLMVGFNRRFAPLVATLKEYFDKGSPVSIQYRINAGRVPADHWTQDPETGGGRIIGEVCHFVDLCTFIAGSPVTRVSAFSMQQQPDLMDTTAITLGFANGSIAAISYFSNGDKSLPKEYLEVFGNGRVACLDDYRQLEVYDGKKKKRFRAHKPDKGHAACLRAFLDSVKDGQPCPVPFQDLYNSSLATFRTVESIRNGNTITI